MATIEKRSSNSYRVTVSCGYDVHGKQIRKKKTFTLPESMTENQMNKEINKLSVLFEKEVKSNYYLDSDKITFAEFAHRWLSDYAEKELAPKTVNRYMMLLERINQSLGDLRLCKIQPLHINKFMSNLSENGIRNDYKYIMSEKYIAHFKEHRKKLSGAEVDSRTISNILKGHPTDKNTAQRISDVTNISTSVLFSPFSTKEKLSSQTLLHHFKLLNTILNTAVRWNLLQDNPAKRVNPPRVEQQRVESLTDDEVSTMLYLLEYEQLKYQAAVHIALFGGLRIGEVIALKWSDIDFMTGKLCVTKSSQYISGMGCFEKSPKNDSSKRELKLPSIALHKLSELKSEQAHERFALGSQWIHTDNIFTQWNGTPIFYSTIGHWFKKWISKTDLPNITFHGLRHSNASLLIAHGTNIATVSKRLGHSRISTTSDIYTHAINKMDEEAANTLDNVFSNKKRDLAVS